jgi:hypothetical protein
VKWVLIGTSLVPLSSGCEGSAGLPDYDFSSFLQGISYGSFRHISPLPVSNKPTTKSRRLIRSPHRQKEGEGRMLPIGLQHKWYSGGRQKVLSAIVRDANRQALASTSRRSRIVERRPGRSPATRPGALPPTSPSCPSCCGRADPNCALILRVRLQRSGPSRLPCSMVPMRI